MEYLFILVGPLLLVLGIITVYSRKKFLKHSTIIQGEVLDIKKGPAQKNRTAYYPIIKYFDPKTSSEAIYESLNPYEPDKYHIGDSVEIRYMNNGDKKKICLNNWSGIWGLPSMLIVFGIIMGVIAFALMYAGVL